jgi:hypothetical protein
MNISLSEAIEIHAKALFWRHGKSSAVDRARERAEILGANGDIEGRDVWTRMTGVIETFPETKKTGNEENGAVV